MSPAPLQRSATLLLLRDAHPGTRVFMVRRSRRSRFLPGAHVFPGGKLEPGDGGDLDLSDAELRQRFHGELDPPLARAVLGGALRELHEETGYDLGDSYCLEPVGHWITPEFAGLRFDTWFLACRAPRGADPGHDDYEVHDSRWIDPRAALGGEGLRLAIPTFHALWDLARFDCIDDYLAHARGRDLPPVLPILESDLSDPVMLLPGDAGYPSDRPVEGPTRLVGGGHGEWWAVTGWG